MTKAEDNRERQRINNNKRLLEHVPDKVRPFFTELEALCKKYKVQLNGCGCCSSPYVTYGSHSHESIGDVNVGENGLELR